MKVLDFMYIGFFSLISLFVLYRLVNNRVKKKKYEYLRTSLLLLLMGYFIYDKITNL